MDSEKTFTHIDQESANPTMVDVSSKNVTQRRAVAQAWVHLPEEMAEHIKDGDILTLKGSVFQTAILAGIQGAKRTSELIPLCHNLFLDKVNVTITLHEELRIEIQCEAKCTGKTGVEMEALTGASVAALTVYDMCKAFSHHITITQVKLLEKTGGKSDYQG